MRSTLLFRAAAAALVLSVAGPVGAANWTVDASHSAIRFSVRHLVSRAHGQFKQFEGAFTFDEKAPGKTTGRFVAKAASIDTNNEKRDGHLRTGDFFEAEKHPDLVIEVKKLTKAGAKGKYKLAADITIRGVTKPVTLNVTHLGSAGAKGSRIAGFEARGKINRKDFGVSWNAALETGGMLLSDEVELILDIEAKEAAAQ